MSRVPPGAARAARELRQKRRTRSGLRWVPWVDIAAELARRGVGRFAPEDLAAAVAALPIEEHQLAPASAADLQRLEQSWRDGWAADFPGEPWPGLEVARRRLRDRLA